MKVMCVLTPAIDTALAKSETALLLASTYFASAIQSAEANYRQRFGINICQPNFFGILAARSVTFRDERLHDRHIPAPRDFPDS